MSAGGAGSASSLDAVGEGGGGFAALYGKVQQINDDVPRNAAQGLKTSAANAKTHTEEVAAAVGSLSKAWAGPSAQEFVTYIDNFVQKGGNVQTSLLAAAKTLDEIADAIKALHEAVDAVLAKALSDAQAAQAAADKATQQAAAAEKPEDVAAHQAVADKKKQEVKDIKATAKGEVERLISEAEEKLATSQAGLKPDLNNDGFVGFPSVNGGVTTPSQVSSIGAMPTSGPQFTSSGGGGSSGGGASYGYSYGGGGGSVGGKGGLGASGPPPTEMPPGNVNQWILEAIKILQANGIPVTEADIPKIWAIIEHESGGNPNAINNWDSNAAKGTPSKGLMQCIDPTFQAHKLPGHDDIYNPVDNIIAGVNYTFDRYGGFDGHPGLKSLAAGGGYKGY